MKVLVICVAIFAGSALTGCGPSGIAKEEMDKFSGTPTPSITPTPEETPIPAALIAQVDTSLDGPVLTVNDERQKILSCTKYNSVSINSDASKVTIKGICQKVVINGDRNQVTADAAMEFAFNGTGNTVTYSRFANGKQPIITENQPGNTAEFAAGPDQKKTEEANKTKK